MVQSRLFEAKEEEERRKNLKINCDVRSDCVEGQQQIYQTNSGVDFENVVEISEVFADTEKETRKDDNVVNIQSNFSSPGWTCKSEH